MARYYIFIDDEEKFTTDKLDILYETAIYIIKKLRINTPIKLELYDSFKDEVIFDEFIMEDAKIFNPYG